MLRRILSWGVLAGGSFLHLVWGAALLLSPDARFATPLFWSARADANIVGLLFLAVGLAGLWAITRTAASWKTLFALLPQQVTLVLSATAIAYSVALGRFLDGVERARGFLLADHLALVIFTVLHIVTLVLMHTGLLRKVPREAK